MSMLVGQLSVGSYFLQYESETSRILERLCRVFERIQEEDGTVICKSFSFKENAYGGFTCEYRTVSSNVPGIKISPISQGQAYEWLERARALEKLEKSVTEARTALTKAETQLAQFNQYIIGEEQQLIEA